MKIVAVTDIHNAFGIVEAILARERADLLILGGDLTTVGSVKDAEEAIRAFQRRVPHLVSVAGNMDLPEHDALFERLGISINARGVLFESLGIFGVSGAPLSPLHTPYEISEEEIAARSERGYANVKTASEKIYVPHAPPYGTKVDIIHSGIHVGSTAVRDFIEERQPDIVLCGHIHEGRGRDTIGRTEIVNCGTAAKGYYVCIEIDHRGSEIALMELTD